MSTSQHENGQKPHNGPTGAPWGHQRPDCAALYAWALQRAYSAACKALLSETWEQATPLLKIWFPEL
jgi:hypothetical protein